MFELGREEMVIVKIFGGLGNELFQYALYRKLQRIGKNVFCDLNSLDEVKEKGFPTIRLFPNIKIRISSEEYRDQLGDVSRKFMARVRRRAWRKKTHIMEDEKEKYFQKEILDKDQVYLDGYWQSELYFQDIRQQLLEELKFPKVQEEKNKKIAIEMGERNSVSVHFRRGDYLQGRVAKIHGGLCSESYYSNAITYFKEKYPNVHFYIFSNDPDWVRKQYQNVGLTIVDWNYGENSYWDMYLMSQCHHNIIANSSFSWWGAWLNQYKGKEVIAPKLWFNPKYITERDTVCKDWIRMEN